MIMFFLTREIVFYDLLHTHIVITYYTDGQRKLITVMKYNEKCTYLYIDKRHELARVLLICILY